jgi:hypothetical protein
VRYYLTRFVWEIFTLCVSCELLVRFIITGCKAKDERGHHPWFCCKNQKCVFDSCNPLKYRDTILDKASKPGLQQNPSTARRHRYAGTHVSGPLGYMVGKLRSGIMRFSNPVYMPFSY